MKQTLQFLKGLAAGALGTLLGVSAALYVLSRAGMIRLNGGAVVNPGDWLHWAYTNLGSSIPVFALLLLAYFVTLGRLRNALQEERPIDQIVQLDHLTDIWTTLFFGTGGYLMRVYKTITLGTRLQRQYDQAARADTSEMRISLNRIEQHLSNTSPAGAICDVESAGANP